MELHPVSPAGLAPAAPGFIQLTGSASHWLTNATPLRLEADDGDPHRPATLQSDGAPVPTGPFGIDQTACDTACAGARFALEPKGCLVGRRGYLRRRSRLSDGGVRRGPNLGVSSTTRPIPSVSPIPITLPPRKTRGWT